MDFFLVIKKTRLTETGVAFKSLIQPTVDGVTRLFCRVSVTVFFASCKVFSKQTMFSRDIS